MTFCVGIRVEGGLVAIADTQIVKGEQISSKAKMSRIETDRGGAFIMTSGLRSIRDKVVLRLDDAVRRGDVDPHRLHELATSFGTGLKKVRHEDEDGLRAGGLRFDLNAIIGGRFGDDDRSSLFHVFPEGNWVEATAESPYVMIGRTYYGKPILDRLLRSDSSLDAATALAYLAFDATRASVNDVDFPFDLVVVDGRGGTRQRRYTEDELESARHWWHDRLADALDEFPLGWADDVAPAGTEPLPGEDTEP